MTTHEHILNAHLDGDSFLWPGGPIGVLLSHGYTATTAEVRPLARLLHSRGFTVAGPLLPGHGTHPNEMNRVNWREWVAALENTAAELARRCRYVFIGGESMGGLLALYTASSFPQAAGALLYSPAVKIPARNLTLSYMARPFMSHKPKASLPDIHPEWKGYRVNPIPAIHQMHRLQRRLWSRVRHMHLPLLIVQGRHDVDIDTAGVVRLYQQYPGPLKEFHWMEESGHVVMMDKEREQVAEISARFMLRVVAQKMPVS